MSAKRSPPRTSDADEAAKRQKLDVPGASLVGLLGALLLPPRRAAGSP